MNEKTVRDIFREFLNEQQSLLNPKKYEEYEETISFLEDYLDGYGRGYLSWEEEELLDEIYEEEDREYCDVFGSKFVGSSQIRDFLEDFMIRKTITSSDSLRNMAAIMHKFVKWLHEKGYMEDKEYEYTAPLVDRLRNDLPKTKEVTHLLHKYAWEHTVHGYTEELNSGFIVNRVEPGKLWFEDFVNLHEIIGPVIVSEEISSMCEPGWMISLQLGKVGDEWRILGNGNMFP
jgi:hypothetical protein